MAGVNVLVPPVESSTSKSAPSVRCYYCNLCGKINTGADSCTICEKYTCAVWMRMNIYTKRLKVQLPNSSVTALLVIRCPIFSMLISVENDQGDCLKIKQENEILSQINPLYHQKSFSRLHDLTKNDSSFPVIFSNSWLTFQRTSRDRSRESRKW